MALLAAGAGALVRGPSARALPAVGTSALSVTLQNDGTLLGTIVVWDPNGSALRYAIDGDFQPLVNALPVNASTRSGILANLNATESNRSSPVSSETTMEASSRTRPRSSGPW